MPGLYLKGHRESWKVLEQKVLAELGFVKTNLGVCWRDIQRGWNQGVLLFTLVLGPRWRDGGPGREEKVGGLGASGGSRARSASVSAGADTGGREGRVWLCNWPGMGVGLRETHPGPSGWEG